MCCFHCSSHQFSGGSYSGFLFCFVLRKQIYFGLEGVAKDKLVFGMKKHGHVSFQVLTEDSYSLNFWIEPLINMLLIVFFYSLSFFIFIFFLYVYPNFCLGCLFQVFNLRVRTFYLPLGLLEACAWCLSCLCSKKK